MNTILYGFQLAPGADDEFVFAPTLADCQTQALLLRAEMRDEHPEMGAIAVYRFEFRSPTPADFMTVLNERDTLLRTCVVERQLVALVVD